MTTDEKLATSCRLLTELQDEFRPRDASDPRLKTFNAISVALEQTEYAVHLVSISEDKPISSQESMFPDNKPLPENQDVISIMHPNRSIESIRINRDVIITGPSPRVMREEDRKAGILLMKYRIKEGMVATCPNGHALGTAGCEICEEIGV